MDWKQLDQSEALAFLGAVRDEKESALFEPSLCEVHTLPISFYDGYSLYRIVNRHMMPYLVLDYLSNGENHYYMDGSEVAFHNLNAREALGLDEGNVIDYLDFYISYVYERGNSLGFVRDRDDSHSARLDGFDGKIFRIQAPLIYDERQIETHIEIEKTGAIHIKDPLQISFLTELKPGSEIRYRHPQEIKIIEETKALLEQTKTGRTLLETGEKAGAETRVLCSPNTQGFITNNLIIYILMPAAEETACYLQAIVLAYSLRDIQQIAQGFIRRRRAEDPSAFVSTNYLKNLDMIAEACKMISEFEERGVPEARSDLRGMKLEEVYRAFKQGAEGHVLMQAYLDSLEKAGLMNKG